MELVQKKGILPNPIRLTLVPYKAEEYPAKKMVSDPVYNSPLIHFSLQVAHLLLQVTHQPGKLVDIPTLVGIGLGDDHLCLP